MKEERTNHVPTNIVPNDIPSNEMPVGQEVATGGGMSGREAPVGGVGPEVVINSRPIRPKMEDGMIRLPVEQFTAMVGVLLTAIEGSGAGKVPTVTPLVSAEGDRKAARRRGVGETNGNQGSRGGRRRAGDREIGGTWTGARVGRARKKWGRAGSPEDDDDEPEEGARPPKGGTRPQKGPFLEDVNSSVPQERVGDRNDMKRERSEVMAPRVKNRVIRSRGSVESSNTLEQVKELRREMRKLREEALRGSSEVVPI